MVSNPYNRTILVVEDEENDRFLIEYVFKKIGIKDNLRLLEDGQEAISYLMGEGKYSDRNKYPYPTFIITDLKMPRADGFEVLAHLKFNPNFSVIPLVVLTSSSDLDDIRAAYALGASAYHIKPHKAKELESLLNSLHDYWLKCEVPTIDKSGKWKNTKDIGKLGEKFSNLRNSRLSQINQQRLD